MRPAVAAVATVATLALALAFAVAAAATTPPAEPAPAPARLGLPVFVLTGGGYGHGVGLGQYGALGQARAGRDHREILAWYYRGTTLSRAPAAKVRVLLASGARTLVVGSDAPFRVRDAAGVVVDVPAGDLTLAPAPAPEVEVEGVPTTLQWPLTLRPGRGGLLSAQGRTYRGELRVWPEQGGLSAVNALSLELYLRGVVPGEVPSAWPAAALRAQAVAARSYALASLVKGKPFDLYADVRSQVYGGAAAETPSTTRAVQETAREILSYAGKPALAFFFSSSGGRTASALDVFGVDLPYLQSVPDPWDAGSPYHRWPAQPFTGAALAKAFGLSTPVVDAVPSTTPSGRPSALRLTTKAGVTVDVPAADVRRRLGLRSTRITLGVLRLAAPSVPAAPGRDVVLTGVARDVDEPVLERLDAGAWTPAARVSPGPDGAFAAVVRQVAATRYRLSALGVPGPTLLVAVAPA